MLKKTKGGKRMIGDFVKSGDFKGEKHVPAIVTESKVKKGEFFEVEVSVGKEIKHPNTIEHHIKWIDLYIKSGEKPVVHVARFDFAPGITDPIAKTKIKLEESSELIAVSYCNLHGLWETSVKVEVE
jgi:superoxide reductase